MQQFLTTETLIIELLLVASLVAMVVRRLHVPYTVALVVVGLLLTNLSPIHVELTPELILGFLSHRWFLKQLFISTFPSCAAT